MRDKRDREIQRTKGGETNSGDLPLFVRCMLTLALNYFVSIANVRLTWIYTPVFTADPNASITVI